MTGARKTAVQLVAVVFVMGAMSFAAVPLYDLFCRVTGYGGTTGVNTADSAHEVLDQTMTVRFDASLARGMLWEFTPQVHEVELKIGETGLAFYEAYNPTSRPIAGQASYNVAPFSAGGFFTKIDCFCFTEQVLQPGERVLMPVTYYIDPAIVEHREGKRVHTITLSYTFYEIPLPGEEVSRGPSPDSDTTVN